MSGRGLVFIVDAIISGDAAVLNSFWNSVAMPFLGHTEAGFVYTGQDLIRDGRRPKNWKPRRDPFLLETSVPGIFAAGDVRHGVIRRVASAVGQGAVAVSLVHKYLESV